MGNGWICRCLRILCFSFSGMRRVYGARTANIVKSFKSALLFNFWKMSWNFIEKWKTVKQTLSNDDGINDIRLLLTFSLRVWIELIFFSKSRITTTKMLIYLNHLKVCLNRETKVWTVVEWHGISQLVKFHSLKLADKGLSFIGNEIDDYLVFVCADKSSKSVIEIN